MALSGEGDALRKAQLAIQQRQNRLVVYDTMNDDDHKLGMLMNCLYFVRTDKHYIC